ncbi:hypothetical protein JFU48_18850 [Pseudomonas sp. TH49]|uniref:hypothetical protein n=1 Tax=Pseudomonas sp. TH49 TaxID=2796413 RepID=UPI001913A1D3|nr:hypothetical protein [Pseudomonas sp. TH49]MBK5343433.1 hypothetical protein [Pseudomonas sp. TH49]
MKLKEWADLKALYKLSRKQPNRILFTWANVRKTWSMWVALLLTILFLVFIFFGYKYPVLLPYAAGALIPWVVMAYRTRLHALRTVFPNEFAAHAIDRQSLREKENFLCYAFFLEIVRLEGYTATKLRELSAYVDLTARPQRPALSQNLGFASLIGFMVALSTEVIKSTSLFKWEKGLFVLAMGFAVLFIYWLFLDGIHNLVYEKGWIKRYLDLAAYDLQEPVTTAPEAGSTQPCQARVHS